MKQTVRNTYNKILVFNPQKKFIAFFSSAFSVAKALNLNVSSIRSACTGKIISYHKLYFRYCNDDLEINFDELGKITLTQYDNLCGVNRKVYENSKMSRKGMKYNIKPKEKSPYYPFKVRPSWWNDDKPIKHLN